MNEITAKKAVRPILRKMEIDDEEIYPAIQRTSVVTTRDKLHAQYPQKNWAISKINDNFFKIKRIS